MARSLTNPMQGGGCGPSLPYRCSGKSARLGIVTVAMGAARPRSGSGVALMGAWVNRPPRRCKRPRCRRGTDQQGESQEILRQFSEQAAQLERVQQQLIQNEKLTAIGQLVQGLAHEMNTPLSVVITNLSVLGRHADNLFAVAQAAQQVVPTLLIDPLPPRRSLARSIPPFEVRTWSTRSKTCPSC